MMNSARFAVGIQALGVSERAYQQALDYAQTRLQGSEKGGVPGSAVSIIRHPDVRRMVMRMRASNEAMRALIYVTAAEFDRARLHPDPSLRDIGQGACRAAHPDRQGLVDRDRQ